MRGIIAVAAAGTLLTFGSPASAQRPFEVVESFFTPPLGNVDSFIDNTFEASFVSIGSAPVELTIQLCDLGGACTSPGFACLNVALTPGKGCSTGNIVNDAPLYAKFILRRTGAGGLDGLGSLRVIGPGGVNSAAVQTLGSVKGKFATED